MKLYAISDLHLANRANREALERFTDHPQDWLILAGDVGETESQLTFALNVLSQRFERLFWVPGNHDLWTARSDPRSLRGEAKYRRLVEICRSFGVATPEDPYVLWPNLGPDGRRYLIAPLFLLYDYSFRPPEIPLEGALDWAAEDGVMCSDEVLLSPDPYPTREAWCHERVRYTAQRLFRAAADGRRLILINHFPLREDLVELRRIPRFKLWCGTDKTQDWHQRFAAAAVVYGHLHIKVTHIRDGVRFEECSLGYPRDWDQNNPPELYLRQILPEPNSWLIGTASP